MNKPLFYLFLILSFPAFCKSGNLVSPEDTNQPAVKSHKLSIGGSFGYGIPTEVYGANDPSYTNTGNVFYADPGIHFDVNMEYHANKHFGLMIQAEGNLNKLDNNYYEIVIAGGDPGLSITGTGGYFLTTLLAGPLFYQTLENGDIFEGWINGGFMVLQYGPVSIVEVAGAPYGGGTTTQTFAPSYGFGGGFQVGIKYKIPITKKAYITLRMAYDQLYEASYGYIYPNSLVPIGLLTGGIGVDFKF